jgi:hypothetical protein
MQSDAMDHGEGFLRQFLNYQFPAGEKFTRAEKKLRIEKTLTELVSFNDQPDSLVLHYILVTERLTLLDNLGNQLILVKGDQKAELLSGTLINDTFIIKLEDDYSIYEYEKINEVNT